MRITRVVAAHPAVRRIFFALSLVLLAGCAARTELGPLTAADPAIAQNASNVFVEYVHPERFRDVGDRYVSSETVRAGYLEALRSHVVQRAATRLSEGQKLSVTITEVDMAGSFEPGRLHDIRVVRDVYPPRIDLRFRLTDPAGAVVKEGERKLRDIAFLTTTVPYRTDPLRYEKALLDNWLDRELARPAT